MIADARVGRSAVEHDVFEVRVPLVQHRADRPLQPAALLVRRCHDRDPRCRLHPGTSLPDRRALLRSRPMSAGDPRAPSEPDGPAGDPPVAGSVVDSASASARRIILARAVSLALIFVGSIILSRTLGPDGRGAHAFYVALTVLAATILGLSAPGGGYILAVRQGVPARRSRRERHVVRGDQRPAGCRRHRGPAGRVRVPPAPARGHRGVAPAGRSRGRRLQREPAPAPAGVRARALDRRAPC